MAEFKRLLATRIRTVRLLSRYDRDDVDAELFGGEGRFQKMEDGRISISHNSRLRLAEFFKVHPSLFRTAGGWALKKSA